ncbi:hypothetical protein MXAN_1902 [Myxococcus xanthus DK 1622]|uniref:Uncharacterized protein n=1 Tax=Myxococcus xanthus (strain DK1622) TaxID=246197 RepID=Q1DB26_MYXXD|nr:hypothetical protein MXAN_1902 [Myxococcus xanthus DK 1622]
MKDVADALCCHSPEDGPAFLGPKKSRSGVTSCQVASGTSSRTMFLRLEMALAAEQPGLHFR